MKLAKCWNCVKKSITEFWFNISFQYWLAESSQFVVYAFRLLFQALDTILTYFLQTKSRDDEIFLQELTVFSLTIVVIGIVIQTWSFLHGNFNCLISISRQFYRIFRYYLTYLFHSNVKQYGFLLVSLGWLKIFSPSLTLHRCLGLWLNIIDLNIVYTTLKCLLLELDMRIVIDSFRQFAIWLPQLLPFLLAVVSPLVNQSSLSWMNCHKSVERHSKVPHWKSFQRSWQLLSRINLRVT